ncbi:hypothetical protein ACT8ZV_03145 [Nocardioides sp. MAHUQ-72]|uniref:hypothetical protein n=1 Tax=unclassified Nocardioides TaxID=2615069 RepID=UPI00361489BC
MRRAWAVAALLPLPLGCASSSGGGDCTSHYEPVADAATRAALKQELLHDVDPRVRSLKVVDGRADKMTVNLLNRRDRVVMSLDMWQRDNGAWTAQQWSQCID